jgi:hypothetical protein
MSKRDSKKLVRGIGYFCVVGGIVWIVLSILVLVVGLSLLADTESTLLGLISDLHKADFLDWFKGQINHLRDLIQNSLLTIRIAMISFSVLLSLSQVPQIFAGRLLIKKPV